MTLWGGRFSQSPTDSVFALSRSIQFDWRLAPFDIVASIAHVHALKRGNVISDSVAESLEASLRELHEQIEQGIFSPIDSDEDVLFLLYEFQNIS